MPGGQPGGMQLSEQQGLVVQSAGVPESSHNRGKQVSSSHKALGAGAAARWAHKLRVVVSQGQQQGVRVVRHQASCRPQHWRWSILGKASGKGQCGVSGTTGWFWLTHVTTATSQGNEWRSSLPVADSLLCMISFMTQPQPTDLPVAFLSPCRLRQPRRALSI
jgi:hypothetical protein